MNVFGTNFRRLLLFFSPVSLYVTFSGDSFLGLSVLTSFGLGDSGSGDGSLMGLGIGLSYSISTMLQTILIGHYKHTSIVSPYLQNW